MENIKSKSPALPRKKSIPRRMMECWELYLFLLPAIVIVAIFKYAPMYGIQIAFKDLIPGKTIAEASWVGFKHFIRFFSSPNSGIMIWNTFKTAIATSVLTFPLSIIFALMLNEVHNERVKKLVQNISYMPYLFSVVIVISVANVFLAPNTGVINILIQKLGSEQILFFGHDKYVLPIYVVTGIWSGLGYGAIIYIAALAGIDQEQLEAAKIDGANRWRVIWHIELPALSDTIVIMLILSWGQMFAIGADKMLLLQTSLNMNASEILSTYVYKVGLLEGQFGFSTAVELFNTTVNVICLLLVNGVAKKINGNSLF